MGPIWQTRSVDNMVPGTVLAPSGTVWDPRIDIGCTSAYRNCSALYATDTT